MDLKNKIINYIISIIIEFNNIKKYQNIKSLYENE
jgi:hypothetical protein